MRAGPSSFLCVRCGQSYEQAVLPLPSRHPIHPEDNGEQPPLAHGLRELGRRQALLRGEYARPCPVCTAGPGKWCREGGTSLFEMHPERRP